ncbi:hypothetical protein Elgi_49380 [Paenibacillus elgii]|uniref:hypothetical protein n=1 Tax=Paenibacillus elgii TaxID=189691 RepID=UPI002D7B6BFD|nr:hypothetical protein Elgi_49380 [Paenibacillus elgii]
MKRLCSLLFVLIFIITGCSTYKSKKVGNVFWGAVKTDKKIETVEVTFNNRNASDSLIKVTIPVVNNVFIGYPTQDFFESELTLSREWKLSAKAFDEEGNIAAETGN